VPVAIGKVEALFRYPVKSMRGEPLKSAALGWHGIDGDRRFAFCRLEERGSFPWLSASKVPELLHYTPIRREGAGEESPPNEVRTPEGEILSLFGEALAARIAARLGAPVQMMQLRTGIFDEAAISVISTDTIREVGVLAATDVDVRRFRPNVVIRCAEPRPFGENAWVGGRLTFGDGVDAASVAVTMRDLRCVMVNFDPDGGPSTPDVMRAMVRANENNAGVSGTVTRVGPLAVGQTVYLHPAGDTAIEASGHS
jgi:uncharacterized protein YcbX